MIEGEKVDLRIADQRDVDTIYEWENDQQYWLVSDTVAPYSREEIHAFIEESNDIFMNNQQRFIIQTKTQEIVGCVDLFDFDQKNKRVGVGILVNDVFRGKGLGKEALELLKEFAFSELDCHCLYADVMVTNENSAHLFASVGFKQVGLKKDWMWDGERFIDEYMYQIVKE